MIKWLEYRNSNSKDIVKRSEGESVRILGWVSSKRVHKDKIFLSIRDRYGYLQIVATPEESSDNIFNLAKTIPVESAIAAEGIVKHDPRAPNGVELRLKDLIVISKADIWPVTKSALKSPEFMYDKRHLTIRGPRSRAILLIRSGVIKAAMEYFEKNDYVLINAPTFITSAVEGGATLFKLKYFDDYAYLTQSSQFYEEAAICVFEKVYVIQPSFRAEKSRTRRHLTEFWHIEAEAAFADHDDIMKVEEELVSYMLNYLNEHYSGEIKTVKKSGIKIYEPPFPRISYDEALEILHSKGVEMEWGEDFGADEERVLSMQFDTPFFVYGYPASTRSFYHMNDPDRPEVTLSSDLMAPDGYGEITSGGQRIHDYNELYNKIISFGLDPSQYEWYLEIRKYGMPPHAGFGLGVERFMRWILELPHIRDATLFPRTPSRVYP
ncbi:asparagine--tRNA ligase [Candidatus Geothermarchaeota archaeon]|nr:MAG: asparagine--tRNA ligase [Candidatus Geothermarchaeota archaeon]